MSEILKSKGIFVFFIFVIIMGVLTTNNINSMKDSDTKNNMVILDNIAK